MSERERIMNALAESDVLRGIRWAYGSAARRTREDYDEPTGHDAGWVGYNRWKLICDRLDRVFSCGKYATQEDSPATVGLDVLFATLTEAEQASYPHIAPGTVLRDNVLGSPGWSDGDVRWLVASTKPGGADNIKWSRRSPLKQRAAKQSDPDSDQLSIFDALSEEAGADVLLAALEFARDINRTTLVLCHSHDVETDARELYLGLPSMEHPDFAWAWKENLLTAPPNEPGRQKPPGSEPDSPSDVPDAPVRLRTHGEKANPESNHEAPRAAEDR